MNSHHDQFLRALQPSKLATILGAASRWSSILLVLTMLISVNFEVIGRSFFGHATIWVTEISTYLVVAITFLGAAFVAQRGANVRVDLLAGKIRPGLWHIVSQALNWVSILMMMIILWKMTHFWQENFTSGARSWSLLNTPLWLPQLSLLIGSAILIGQLLLSMPSDHPKLDYLPILLAFALAVLDGTGIVGIETPPTLILSLLGCLILLGALLTSGTHVFGAVLALILPVLALFAVTASADISAKSLTLVAILFLLLLSGLPVVFALMTIGVTAMIIWLPPVSLNYIGERAWEAVNTFELSAIPMFVLMGALLVRSNASVEMFTAAQKMMGRLRGGLAHASVLASGIFAAVSGSSLATAATMGRVAGPEMIKQGYKPELAYGVLAAGGTLGILIPPSIAMIVYGPLAGVPVTQLFMAGIIPGLLMIGAFSLTVIIWTTLDASAAPKGQSYSLAEKLRALKGVIPFLILMTMVLGSLYAGFATPTEAGAVGVLGALLVSFARKTLSWREFWLSLEEAALTTSFLLMIAVGASIMSFTIDFLAMPQALVSYVEGLGLSDLGLFCAIVLLYLVLGMFVEPISMVLMTLPIILPVISAAGWDLLWFGIVLVMLVEIGLITPPVGMILYVLSGVSDTSIRLGQIALGTLPFVGVFLTMVFLFFWIPDLVTYLPEILQ